MPPWWPPKRTSTQIEVVFLDALTTEGLLTLAEARASEALRAALASGKPEQLAGLLATGTVPLLLAISDNAPADALLLHPGVPRRPRHRPAVRPTRTPPPTRPGFQTLFGHVKGEWPHLEKITNPGELERELARVRLEYNTVRLHAGIGYLTPDDEHTGRGDAIRQARRNGLTQARKARITYRRHQTEEPS